MEPRPLQEIVILKLIKNKEKKNPNHFQTVFHILCCAIVSFTSSGTPDFTPSKRQISNPISCTYNIATAIDPTYKRRQHEIEAVDETEPKIPLMLSRSLPVHAGEYDSHFILWWLGYPICDIHPLLLICSAFRT